MHMSLTPPHVNQTHLVTMAHTHKRHSLYRLHIVTTGKPFEKALEAHEWSTLTKAQARPIVLGKGVLVRLEAYGYMNQLHSPTTPSHVL